MFIEKPYEQKSRLSLKYAECSLSPKISGFNFQFSFAIIISLDYPPPILSHICEMERSGGLATILRANVLGWVAQSVGEGEKPKKMKREMPVETPLHQNSSLRYGWCCQPADNFDNREAHMN